MRQAGITHGRKGYIYHHCRCDICREAQNTYSKEYQRRRVEEARSGGRPFRAGRRRISVATATVWEPWGDWAELAACKGSDSWLMPVRAMHSRNARRNPEVVAAIAKCSTCPVLEQCRQWVMSHRDDPCKWHVVAAMTPQERNAQRRTSGMRIPGKPATHEGTA